MSRLEVLFLLSFLRDQIHFNSFTLISCVCMFSPDVWLFTKYISGTCRKQIIWDWCIDSCELLRGWFEWNLWTLGEPAVLLTNELALKNLVYFILFFLEKQMGGWRYLSTVKRGFTAVEDHHLFIWTHVTDLEIFWV